MKEFCVTRRIALGLIGSGLAIRPSLAQTARCTELQRTRLLAEANLQGVGVWVTTDGPTLLLNARQRHDALKRAMPATGATLSAAHKDELLNLIGLMGGATLLIIGVTGAPASALILAGLSLSTGLLIGRALTAPNTLDPQEAVALQTAGDIERALVAAGASGPTAARTAANTAGTLVGGATTLYNFSVWLNSVGVSVTAETEFEALRAEIATIETILARLDAPGALGDIRHDAMTALFAEVSEFPCSISLVPN